MKELENQQHFNGSILKSSMGQAQSIKMRNKSIVDKKSDTASQAGFNAVAMQMQQKNEEERLKIP